MPNKTSVQIRAPKFELYELVTLHWNSEQRRTKIVQRWFNPDDGTHGHWFYKVCEDSKFYPEGSLDPRLD